MHLSPRVFPHINYATVIFCSAFLLSACSGGNGNEGSLAPIQLDRTASVMGVDTTQSGIRDDIKALITRMGTPDQQKPLEQVARAIQSSLLKNETQLDAVTSADSIDKALGCLRLKSPDYVNQAKALFSATVNTEARFMALIKFESALKDADLGDRPAAECIG